jgi:hypothetical protein
LSNSSSKSQAFPRNFTSPHNISSKTGEYVNGLSANLKLIPSTAFLSDRTGELRKSLNGVNPEGRTPLDVLEFVTTNWAAGRSEGDGVGRMALKD